MAAAVTKAAAAPSDTWTSPFQETDWDRRLDGLIRDLESSNQEGRTHPTTRATRGNAASSGIRIVPLHSSSGPSETTQRGASAAISDSAGDMLRDLDSALEASSNYIETHRTVTGPNGTREYREYRTYHSDGHDGRNGESRDGDFDLESRVRHMIPTTSTGPRSLATPTDYDRHNQTNYNQQSSYSCTSTSYKVQSRTFGLSGNGGSGFHDTSDLPEGERPGSRLKQNIDELDTLLSDLHRARDSDGQSRNDKADLSYSSTYSSRTSHEAKPPSPLPGRRRPSPGPYSSPGPVPGSNTVLASPQAVRRVSPGPQKTGGSAYTYQTSSSSSYYRNGGIGNENDPYLPSSRRSPSPPPTGRDHSPYGLQRPGHQSSPGPPMHQGSHMPQVHQVHQVQLAQQARHQQASSSSITRVHQSRRPENAGSPLPFPTTPSPPHGRSQSAPYGPPKRVEELMKELGEFDPSLGPADWSEPVPQTKTHSSWSRHANHDSTDTNVPRHRSTSHSPAPASARPSAARQPSTPGPPVYYPPGDAFSSPSSRQTTAINESPLAAASASQSLSSSGRGKAKGKREHGYKDKGRFAESESKGGAAVVPICLPLCCAAPCVIL